MWSLGPLSIADSRARHWVKQMPSDKHCDKNNFLFLLLVFRLETQNLVMGGDHVEPVNDQGPTLMGSGLRLLDSPPEDLNSSTMAL